MLQQTELGADPHGASRKSKQKVAVVSWKLLPGPETSLKDPISPEDTAQQLEEKEVQSTFHLIQTDFFNSLSSHPWLQASLLGISLWQTALAECSRLGSSSFSFVLCVVGQPGLAMGSDPLFHWRHAYGVPVSSLSGKFEMGLWQQFRAKAVDAQPQPRLFSCCNFGCAGAGTLNSYKRISVAVKGLGKTRQNSISYKLRVCTQDAQPGLCPLLLPCKQIQERNPGMVQKLDQKLPVANEYLLLSGGVREGVVDIDLDELNVYARGTDYDMDFTLLVPALKLHDRNQPVTLDMRHSALCHSWLSLRLFDEGTISKWKDCCTIVDHINGATNYFFSPTKVADWFYESISIVLSEIQKKPQRGMPKVEKVEKNGTIISIILGVGSSRMLYDIVPVVSFKGWPAVAQSWLMENHFWDGKITEEEVISGFYLVPACSYKGKKDNEWRLSFARSEVQLKKCISSSLMQAYQACKAIIIKLLSRPKAISPYHLRSMMLWACDRLPASYLAQEDYAAHFLLGLIDDLQHCLVNKMCPNYFIPQCNMLEHLSEDTVMLHARKLSSVRSDPAEHLRTAIEHVKAANRLTLELQRRGSTTSIPSPQSDGGDPNQPDDRLAKKLQQLGKMYGNKAYSWSSTHRGDWAEMEEKCKFMAALTFVAHLAMAVPEKVHPSQLELVPAQGADCSARLAQQQPRIWDDGCACSSSMHS
ncbi:hypothetical protein IHE44_0001967 [Lamprotornis superbus]|uniref:Nucleotidyltransferase MB21D2 n=1 Tax=Lamprotornis superbus TaxID=245042 RepID=A0A835NIQ8_9PASS|nr:hypothetical protein IHE44_0001967 [Lamprotornis superbus]